MSKKLTNEEFIKNVKLLHNNMYDYSKVEYNGDNKKVKIICKIHGEFEQTPGNHKSGKGCPKCKGKKLNNIDIINEFKKIHGDRYDYFCVNYVNGVTKVKIKCVEHGVFEQTPSMHKSGQGCKKCYGKEKLNHNIVIDNFLKTHGKKYNYSKVNYVNAHSKVSIICPEHGKFEQTPNNHKNGNGCPQCNESNGETKVRVFLEKNNIFYIPQHKFFNCKNSLSLPFDFYIPDANICIEFNGLQHYKPIEYFGGKKEFEKRKINDKIKQDYCIENSIELIKIKYNDDVEVKIQKLCIPRQSW